MPEIDFKAPLETDETPPRAVKPCAVRSDGYGDVAYAGRIGEWRKYQARGECLWRADGTAIFPGFPSIRNVRSESSDTWGREIRVDGVRPAWLMDDSPVSWRHFGSSEWTTSTANARSWTGSKYCPAVSYVRLPADHWAYRALDAGFEPWPGGDNAPDDWDGGGVLLRGGLESYRPQKNDWQRGYNGDPTKYAHLDIIGYRRKSEPTLRTSDEALQRMEALVRRMAADALKVATLSIYDYGNDLDEAREIVKLLPEPPVDPDKQAAQDIVDVSIASGMLDPADKDVALRAALAGVLRGRELAVGS